MSIGVFGRAGLGSLPTGSRAYHAKIRRGFRLGAVGGIFRAQGVRLEDAGSDEIEQQVGHPCGLGGLAGASALCEDTPEGRSWYAELL